jgi:hypothetical protein
MQYDQVYDCRWGAVEEGSASDDDSAALTAEQKQRIITRFLKSALTESLLSVTNRMFKEVATYATFPIMCVGTRAQW